MPAYRHLSDDEKISMRQCVDVLGGHDIIVIHPERLDLTEDLQSWQSVVVKALRNEWFDGVKGYNSMLLSTEFYDLFSVYDYILIYQLDAYVFRNELDEWVAKGYDYIGAPWIIKRGLSYYLFGGWMQALHRKLHPIGEGENMVHAHLAFSVGNGGLSLRRVSKMREMAEQFADEISRLRFGEERRAAEDVFFSLVAGRRCGLKKRRWRLHGRASPTIVCTPSASCRLVAMPGRCRDIKAFGNNTLNKKRHINAINNSLFCK